MSDALPEWVPFSERYGYRTHLETWGQSAFGSRHSHRPGDKGWSHCERDERFRCICPSSPDVETCCHRATAEDRLCDACRKWCTAVDSEGNHHRLVDVYEASA